MKFSILASSLIFSSLWALDTNNSDYSVVLPTIEVEGISEQNTLKGYIAYDSADINRNGLSNKETPQTIENIDIQKNRNYGTNDLSSILEGNAGIDAGYDMRGESIKIRGFSVDGGDIYRDGVRDSGQIRRSTANVERVEI
ncbi:TonB-dependent receptor plug domain-containing protein [Campylobacter concisus]|nr:TonB-dependent receptor plug domain-containing protein [Campylobacter concisus]